MSFLWHPYLTKKYLPDVRIALECRDGITGTKIKGAFADPWFWEHWKNYSKLEDRNSPQRQSVLDDIFRTEGKTLVSTGVREEEQGHYVPRSLDRCATITFGRWLNARYSAEISLRSKAGFPVNPFKGVNHVCIGSPMGNGLSRIIMEYITTVKGLERTPKPLISLPYYYVMRDGKWSVVPQGGQLPDNQEFLLITRMPILMNINNWSNPELLPSAVIIGGTTGAATAALKFVVEGPTSETIVKSLKAKLRGMTYFQILVPVTVGRSSDIDTVVPIEIHPDAMDVKEISLNLDNVKSTLASGYTGFLWSSKWEQKELDGWMVVSHQCEARFKTFTDEQQQLLLMTMQEVIAISRDWHVGISFGPHPQRKMLSSQFSKGMVAWVQYKIDPGTRLVIEDCGFETVSKAPIGYMPLEKSTIPLKTA